MKLRTKISVLAILSLGVLLVSLLTLPLEYTNLNHSAGVAALLRILFLNNIKSLDEPLYATTYVGLNF
jgi:hypothetical protein